MVLNSKGISDFGSLVSSFEKQPLSIVAIIFDVLHLNGKSRRQLPLERRRRELEQMFEKSSTQAAIRLAPLAPDAKPEQLIAQIAKAGGEGIIAKRRSSLYRSGRSKSWLKLKVIDRDDFVIVGYIPSTKGQGIASLLVAEKRTRRLNYAGRVGTGFSQTVVNRLMSQFANLTIDEPPKKLSVPADISRQTVWLEPTLIGEIAFNGRTAGGRLRGARFLGLREDRQMEVQRSHTDSAKKKKKRISITHPDRIIFPDSGFTKGDVADYYRSVGKRMLPYVAGHPVSLIRAPDGIESQTFFQRHPMAAMNAGLERFKVKGSSKSPYMAIADIEGILTAVQFGAIEFHIWGAVVADIDAPDRIVFDLDPGEGVKFEDVKNAAYTIRKILKSAGLTSFPLLTGGKGLHVVVPLDQTQDWLTIEKFAKGFAQRLAAMEPDRFVAKSNKSARKKRIFIDYLRNKKTATAIAPYSLRARPSNAIACPVSWRGLQNIEAAAAYHAANFKLPKSNPWRGYATARQRIAPGVLKTILGN